MNDTLHFFLTNVLPSIITGVATWLVTRKKNMAEVSASELDNVEKALVIYRSIINDLNGKIKQLEQELEEMERVVSEHKNKNHG